MYGIVQKKSNENCRILLIALFKFHQTLVQKFKGRFSPKSDISLNFHYQIKVHNEKLGKEKTILHNMLNLPVTKQKD